MQKIVQLSLIAFALATLMALGTASSCNGPARDPETADSLLLFTQNTEFFYNLRQPGHKHLLPEELREVSGLSYCKQEQLLMVDDEQGAIFTYDLQKQEVVHKFTFTEPGDFEGVQAVGDTVYALRSDGTLFKMEYTNANRATAREISTPLGPENDTEGLGYDPEENRLLIACKARAGYQGHELDGRAVYAYSLDKAKMIENEFFHITREGLEEYYERVKGGDYQASRFRFGPSGIAYHPIEGHFYVLAHKGRLLLVLSRQGDILGSYPVPRAVLQQAEGICFSPGGDMYISSEGVDGPGYFIHFQAQRR